MRKWRNAAAICLAVCMSVLLACPAFAAGSTAGAGTDQYFDVYQIFTGQVSQDGDSLSLLNPVWGQNGKGMEGEPVGEATMSQLAEFGFGNPVMESKIVCLLTMDRASGPYDDGTTVYKHVAYPDLIDPAVTQVPAGYYYIENTPGSVTGNSGYTAGIVTAFDGRFSVMPKAGTASVSKIVRGPDGTYGSCAAAGQGETVTFVLKAYLPENIAYWNGLWARFEDDIPEGVDIDPGSVAIQWNGGNFEADAHTDIETGKFMVTVATRTSPAFSGTSGSGSDGMGSTLGRPEDVEQFEFYWHRDSTEPAEGAFYQTTYHTFMEATNPEFGSSEISTGGWIRTKSVINTTWRHIEPGSVYTGLDTIRDFGTAMTVKPHAGAGSKHTFVYGYTLPAGTYAEAGGTYMIDSYWFHGAGCSCGEGTFVPPDVTVLPGGIGDVITVTYDAMVSPDAAAAEPNTNTAVLRWSNDPNEYVLGGYGLAEPEHMGTTVPASASVYTAGLTMRLADGETGEAIAGMDFELYPDSMEDITCSVRESGPAGISREYDHAELVPLKTGEDGSMTVTGLPVGTYRLCMTGDIPGYSSLGRDVRFTVLADAGCGIQYSIIDEAESEGIDANGVEAYAQDNWLRLDMPLMRGLRLPVTGGDGITAVYSSGAMLLAAGLVVACAKKRRIA